jgi:clan AA aspartic protease (TIGR02281 family)
MRKFLLTTVFAVAAIGSAHAELKTTHMWSISGDPVSVMQVLDTQNDAQFCAANFASSDQMEMSLAKNARGSDFLWIGFRQNGGWSSGGRVTFAIDGESTDYTMTLTKSGDLIVSFEETDFNIDFLHALYNGQTLSVAAGQRHATFSLTGSANGITLLNRCRDKITVEAGGTPPAPNVSRPSPAPSDGGFVTVQMQAHGHNGFTLPVLLNGEPVTFLLDTGASGVSISRTVARRLGLRESDIIRYDTFSMADGRKQQSPIYNVQALSIGGITLHNIEVDVSSDDDMPLLGQGLLQKFRSVAIDNESAMLTLKSLHAS